MKSTRTGILLLMTLLAHLTTAQHAQNFHFRKFQVNDGLSESTVGCILQDKQGFIWLGTKDGLNKFDGIRFKIFRNNNHPGSIGNNFIKCLTEGINGELYVGTENGLYRMNPADETFERLENTIPGKKILMQSITGMIRDANDNYWISTHSDGVFLYNPSKKTIKRIPSSSIDLRSTLVWTIFADKSGVIWAGTRSGLFRYNTQLYQFEPIELLGAREGHSAPEIMSIFEDQKGNFWLGTWSDGIILYNRHLNNRKQIAGPSAGKGYITHIHSFLQYDPDNLLVGADDGLFMLNIESHLCSRIDIPLNPNSLSDQNVYSMLRDREGGIWIGTYFGGLNYLNKSTARFETYLPGDKANHLSGKAISQFCEDPSGNIWIATEDGGLNYFDTRKKTFSQPVKTSYHNLHPLLLDGDELWIGTFSRGVDVYNTRTGNLRNYRTSSENIRTVDDNCTFALHKTRDGDIYVGTTIGLNKFNRATGDFTRIEEGKIRFVYDIREDEYGHLWIASFGNGLVRRDAKSEKWIYYDDMLPLKHPLVKSRLTSIYIDSQKRLWITSEGQGIFLYDYQTDSFTNITENEGLPNNVVYGIIDDQYGNLWVSSNLGLVSFKPDKLNQKKHYLQEDGLQSNQFNFKSSFKASDGKLYFGGINGFNCFYPQSPDDNLNKIVPEVVITSFNLLEQNSDALSQSLISGSGNNQTIKLRHYQSAFTISFVSLSYISEKKNQYAYKLEGIDDDWIYIGNSKSVTYVNLAPGNYRFRVKASNNDGVWNETGAMVSIHIAPPFWDTLLARFIYFLIFAFAAYYTTNWFIKRNRSRHKQQLDNLKTEQETISLKSKIDFFTNIAHEIRTPVSLIKAPLEDIIQSGDGNENTRSNLSIIMKNCDRLIVLVKQLLDFRKMDAQNYTIHYEKLKLKQVLSELYERFRKTAQSRKIDFRLELPADVDPEIISEADILVKITGNFLTNAIKFTTSRILLKLETTDDGSFTISVEDDGPGIPDELKTRIFNPFFQVQANASEGTGIGLFLTQHLAELLKGRIEVVDAPDGGSIFSFRFKSSPIILMEENNEAEEDTGIQLVDVEESEQTGLHNRTGNYHILVVEDNPEMLQFIKKSLERNYQIETAQSVKEAYKFLENKSFDLIISDIMMPETDGISFTRQLREDVNYCHIPVILLSAHTEDMTKIDGLRSGADVFIEKPFSTPFLKAQIDSLLGNRKTLLDSVHKSPVMPYTVLATNRSDKEFINRLNDEIDRHISDSSLSIESLTDKLFISRSNFQRKLKSICGLTPADYLRTYRLKKASQLLLENDHRVNEVAFEVGFSSASYFTKCFIRQFGLSPKEYIKQHKTDPG